MKKDSQQPSIVIYTTDDEKARIADKMKAKDTLIEKFRKYEDINNKAERLEKLINKAKKLEKAGLGINSNPLFTNKDYL